MNKNQGIGGYDEPERAFVSENHNNTFRAQEVGPLGRRFFINTRLNVGWSDSERQSAVEGRRFAFSTRIRSAAPRKRAAAIRAT